VAERNEKLDRLADEMGALARLSPNGIFLTDSRVRPRGHVARDTSVDPPTHVGAPMPAVRALRTQGHVVSANDQWFKITGLKELGGGADRWRDRIHPDDRAEFDQKWQAFEAGHSTDGGEAEFRLLAPDCTATWVYAQFLFESAAPPAGGAGSDGGKRARIIAALTDITQRKRLEQERLEALEHAAAIQQQRMREAEQHRREQERFVDVICHEMRNPLSGIINNLDLLRSGRERAERMIAAERDAGAIAAPAAAHLLAWLADEKDMLRAIDVCATHQVRPPCAPFNMRRAGRGHPNAPAMARRPTGVRCPLSQRRISDDMLQLSRLHAGRFVMNPRPFAVGELTANLVRMFSAEAAALQTAFTCTLGPAVPPELVVVADGQRIMQILINLVSNALKFSQKVAVREVAVHIGVAPPVDLTPSPSASSSLLERSSSGLGDGEELRLLIDVVDRGVGMSEEEQAKLFMPFAQANAKTYSSYGGSGLGLFICKALLDAMHGRITVRSAPNEGCTFSVQVPCRRAPAGAPAAAGDAEPPPHLLSPPTDTASLTTTASVRSAYASPALFLPDATSTPVVSPPPPSNPNALRVLGTARLASVSPRFGRRIPPHPPLTTPWPLRRVDRTPWQSWTTTTSTAACCAASCRLWGLATLRWSAPRMERSPLTRLRLPRTTSSSWTSRCPSSTASRPRCASASWSAPAARPRPCPSSASRATRGRCALPLVDPLGQRPTPPH